MHKRARSQGGHGDSALFCNPANFDGCKAKAFRKGRDGRTRILMVARDKPIPRPTSSGNGLARTLTGS